MSADARAWKNKLREHGVNVVEYEQDYGVAVVQGRKEAEQDPRCFFIDDENSNLVLGYSVAGERLKQQFEQQIEECVVDVRPTNNTLCVAVAAPWCGIWLKDGFW